jgi:hypothetical protein
MRNALALVVAVLAGIGFVQLDAPQSISEPSRGIVVTARPVTPAMVPAAPPARNTAPAPEVAALPDEPTFSSELRVADDGRWLEVLPLSVDPHEEAPAADVTVIWQGDDGLITLHESDDDRAALNALPALRAASNQREAQALLDEARAALASGQLLDARRRASLAGVALPDDERVYAMLGDIAVAGNDVEEARWNYERAEQRSNRSGRYLATLERLTKERHTVGTLERFETEHFVVSSPWLADAPNALLLRDELERAWTTVEAALATAPRRKLPVVLYRHEQFSERVDGVLWAAGDFDGRVRLSSSAVGTGALRGLLVHELTHAFIADRGAKVPAWLDEGLAQWVAAAGAPPPAHAAGHAFPLSQLAGGFGRFESCREARLAYATAHHAAASLAEQHGPAGLQRLVQAMSPTSGLTFFERALGVSLETFIETFDHHETTTQASLPGL